ncbi:MAG: acetyl-CoA hydrolase, partial [Bacteroidales bacterium]|nr:acetyl-CoA hydrolase [Bacteroidales bacterium]
GNIKFASGSSLTCSKEAMDKVMGDLNFFRNKIILRPQEISNSPEVVRRIGLIAINTAIECDIFGNMNSTHFYGTKVMNGIGGSGDFLRNSYLSICTTPSTAKGGMISSIVPMVTHLDHSEHSLKVIVSEYGVADLRAKAPIDRAKEIIEKVAHPDYRELLWDYLKLSTKPAHTMQTLDKAFKMHLEFLSSGDMRNTKW